MDSSVKNFFYFLGGAVLLLAIILGFQIKKALTITAQSKDVTLVASVPTDIPLAATDPTLGNPGADLTIIEYTDFNNPKSRSLDETLRNFTMANLTKVRLIWKDAPQDHLFSGNATPAHLAARCAGRQGKFWDYVGEMNKNVSNMSEGGLQQIANSLKLNMDAWQACRKNDAVLQEIKDNSITASQLNITPPALFLNNKQFNLAENVDLNQLLNSLISP